MERKLASIQIITNLEPIEGRDRIVKAKILGWDVVVGKDEFIEKSKCIFFEIDALLPNNAEWAKFMESCKYRVRTVKFAKQFLSQGLALPTSILPGATDLPIGADVTDLLNIKKYELPFSHNGGIKMGCAQGNYPKFLTKTDEIRAQSAPEVLDELRDAGPFYVSVKVDGTSSTFVYDRETGEFLVCSRNFIKKEDDTNVYWNVARKYNLAEVLKGTTIAIQGEIVAPGLQGNKLCVQEPDLYVFNIYDYDTKHYFDFNEFIEFCDKNKLQTVPIESIVIGEGFDYSLANFLKMADGKYKSGKDREGIVVRPLVYKYSPALQGRLSFKIISNRFLLKTGE